MRLIMLTSALVASLSGCKTLMSADIYTSDLLAVIDGEELTAPLTVGIPFPTISRCEELSSPVLDAVQQVATDMQFTGCEDRGFQTFGFFRSGVPVVSKTPQSSGSPFTVTVSREDEDAILVQFRIDPDAPQAVWDALPEELTQYQSFRFEPQLSALITNDLREDVRVITDDVFANGKPIQGTQEFVLNRREQVDVRLSDVTNSAFSSIDAYADILRLSPK